MVSFSGLKGLKEIQENLAAIPQLQSQHRSFWYSSISNRLLVFQRIRIYIDGLEAS
jgi:hypothetical protein